MASEGRHQGGSRFCANCGAPLEAGSQFCANCGQPVAAATPSAGSTPPPGAPPSVMPSFVPAVTPSRSGGTGKCLIIAGVAVLGLLLLLCCGGVALYFLAQAPTPTPSPFPFPPTSVPVLQSTATPTAAVPATAAPATAVPSLAATATPTALPKTATPAVAATATAAPKPSATPTRAATPGVLFLDDFSSRQASLDKGWSLDPSANVDYAWSQGKLTIAVKKAQWMGSDWPTGDYQDFAAEADAQPVGADYAEYGIVFRVSGPTDAKSYYVFGLRTDGKAYVYQKVGGAWIDQDALPLTSVSQAKPGAVKNTLGVIVQGNKISLLVNRVLVKTVVDNSVSAAGRVGLFATTGANTNCTVAFTRLTILTVEKAKADWGVP